MEHTDHVRLLRDGVIGGGSVWADLGSGWGAFTLALADLLGPHGQITSVDKDRGSLTLQEREMRARFPSTQVRYVVGDFTRSLELPPLDGIVMANSLHYVKHKEPVLHMIRAYLKPGGRFILVEYNADRGNPWVPHPLSFATWQGLAARVGFGQTRLLATVPSRFLREIYSAVSW
jgi:ubiquinone/menaquinone biosynthesis C-methylase UbiE